METKKPYIIAGILTAITVAAFFLFLWPHFLFVPGLFYTNLVAAVLSIWLTATNIFDCNIFQGITESDKTAAGRGIMWVTGLWYEILTIALIILSFIFVWDYIYVIFGHAVLICLVVIIFLFSGSLHKSVNSAMKEINDRAASLECVKASLSGLLLEADLAGIPMEGINEIKENIRMITPSTNPQALEIERRLNTDILSMKEKAAAGNTSNEDVNNFINKCQILIRQRKQIY